MFRTAMFSVALIIAIPSAAIAHPADDKQSSGTIKFPVQCAAQAAADVERGVVQMHSMMYLPARELFQAAAKADPSCAIALWGEAMSYIHPLWPDRSSPATLAVGADLTARATKMGGHDARETAYITTATAYFAGGSKVPESERLANFESAWKAVYKANPGDNEAKAFYALSQLATADRSDKTYAKRKAAGALAEQILAAEPTHPGAHHYIIHAYDVPALAERALPVAENYGVIAPVVPHALHMTSHIFTREGLWDQSIEWNRRSADAAWELSQANGAISMHYLHALDYLAYAHLQKGEDDKALKVVHTMALLTAPFGSVSNAAQAYAFAASPARYALERRDWAAAAALQPRIPSHFPWTSKHDAYVALTHFARGLGMAHEGRFEGADAEVAMLVEIGAQTGPRSPYWANQVEILRLSAEAWVTFLRGDQEGGLAVMRAAVKLEASTDKSPVTPGAVLPAAELLGDMLVELKSYGEAIDAYQVALSKSPRRLNSLYGAAQAEEKRGDPGAAKIYYAQIAAMASETSTRPAVKQAQNF